MRTVKVVIGLSSLLVTALALSPPVSTYHASIFDATHLVVLGILTLLTILGVSLVATSLVFETDHWKGGVIAIGCSYGGYFALPLALGYGLLAAFSYDLWSHYGLVLDVLESGHLPETDYVATHTLFSTLSIVTGLDPKVFAQFVPFVCFSLFIILSVLLTRIITGNTGMALAVGLGASPLAFGVVQVVWIPWTQSLFFIPFVLFIVHKRVWTRERSWVVTVVLVGLAVSIYHPITAVWTIIAVAVYTSALWITTHDTRFVMQQAIPVTAVIGTIIGSWLLYWFVIGDRVTSHLQAMLLRLMEGSPGSVQRVDQAGESSYTLLQVLEFFILPQLGVVLGLFFISGVTFLVIAGRFYRAEESLFEVLVATGMLIGGAVAVAMTIVQFYSTSLLRSTQLLTVFTTLATGIGIWFFAVRYRSRIPFDKAAVTIVIVLMMSSFIIFGAATAYPKNTHMTDQTLEGYSFLLDSKTSDAHITAKTGRDRFGWYHFGFNRGLKLRANGYIFVSLYEPPHRLGYQGNDSISNSVQTPYLVTRTADLKAYQSLPDYRLREIDYYTSTDIQRLRADPSAERVYTGGDYTVWYVSKASS
jgi:hypothetical protein